MISATKNIPQPLFWGGIVFVLPPHIVVFTTLYMGVSTWEIPPNNYFNGKNYDNILESQVFPNLSDMPEFI